MKKATFLLVILLLASFAGAFCQIPLDLKARHRTTGEMVTFKNAGRSRGSLIVQTALDPATGKTNDVKQFELRQYEFFPGNIESLWQKLLLESKVYDDLLKSGYDYEQRFAMEEMMKDYINSVEQTNSFYIDSYLEAKLYSILRMVYPVRHTDKRPGILSLRILAEITPDAWVGPDGTMIITTGMITAVNSEAELMALMAQEVAHFALDHQLARYKKLLVSELEPALGNVIRYTTQQELLADKCAVSVLLPYSMKSSALASMLKKVLEAGELMGNYYLGSASGYFPDAATRAATYSDTVKYFSTDYERLIAPVMSFNAFMAYNQSHYLLCRRLLERNIASGVATADDMVLLSQAMMNLSGSDTEDEQALSMVRSVTEGVAEPPPGAFKQEALLLLRMDRRDEAETALLKCVEALDREEKKYSAMPGDWSQMMNYLQSEKDWVKRTLRR
ncbi:MAG: M48 family metalloprotease [Bacteroidales bacterium]|nr:M48 family metalloprotease [Bacteroidales bacterium]